MSGRGERAAGGSVSGARWIGPAVAWSAALVLAAPAAAQNRLVVVDQAGGPGAHYTNLQAAVQGSADGTAIVVRDGTYGPLVISGKGLTVVAENGHRPVISETIHVDQIQPEQVVAIRGFDVAVADISYGGTFERCRGPVLVEDTTFGGSGGALVSGGLLVTECEAVSFVRVTSEPTLTAGASLGRSGLLALDSNVYVYESTLTGPDGISNLDGPLPGADGATVLGGFLFSAGSTLRGGAGGDGTSFFGIGCSDGGNGGSGLRLTGDVPDAWLLDNRLTGGEGGLPTAGCIEGDDGPDLRNDTGNATELPGALRRLAIASPVRENEELTEVFTGLEDEFVVVGISPMVRLGDFVFDWRGIFYPGEPNYITQRGFVPQGGVRTTTTEIRELGPGVDSLVLYVQAAFFDMTTGESNLSAPTVVVLVDEAL